MIRLSEPPPTAEVQATAMQQKRLFCPLVLAMLLCGFAQADDAAVHEEAVRKTTAVALNYCRAALHRIRRVPEKGVFHEEQTRILNNLNLNQIEDQEVVALYKSILDEISHVEISERERVVINEQFRRNIHRQLGTSFFVIGAQVATGQLGNVVQSGANSWWDYRNQEVRRDSDQWKVEKTEFTNLMSRSSTFLDSFWRLSQKNKIPDEWLIRDQDLDQLARVLQERDAAQRLRMLGRLERFMECYPPYWYYVARTQQHLGLAEEALETYQRLTEIGSGHFRQDDMLASCMANTALLQEMAGHPDAAQTAARVTEYSIRNWESNLICAWVLGRHQQFGKAEELILCNLDEDQEAGQSRIALVSLFYHSDNKAKLATLLNDPSVVREVPIPGLLLCAKLLSKEKMPANAQAYLASTLSASVHRVGRGNAITLAAAAAWKIQDAQPEVVSGTNAFHVVGYRPDTGGVRADFITETGEDSFPDNRPIQVTLNYPGTPAILVTLNPPTRPEPQSIVPQRVPFVGGAQLSLLPRGSLRYEIGAIELDGLRISFRDDNIEDARVEDSKEVSAGKDTPIKS